MSGKYDWYDKRSWMMIKRGFCTCMLVCTCAGGSCRFAEEVVVVVVFVWSKWPDSTYQNFMQNLSVVGQSN
jgi:hypothetical protein